MSTSTDITNVATEPATIIHVSLNEIKPSPTNPRTHFASEDLQDLQSSMRAHGFKSAFPIYVRPWPKGKPGYAAVAGGELPKYEVIAGERRWRCASAMGISTVPIVVEEIDDRMMLELQVVENVQRKALTPLEEGGAYARMKDEFGYTLQQISDKVGFKVGTIAKRIKMLLAPKILLDALSAGTTSERQCYLVAAIPDKKLREQAGKRVIDGEWDHNTRSNQPLTVAGTKKMIRENFMVSLKGCEWTLEDAQLLPEAGPCSSCPFMAKNNPEMQDDLQSGGSGKGGIDPLTCTHPTCYGRKMDALWKRKQLEARTDKHIKVASQTETKKIFQDHGGLRHDSGYVRLGDKPGHDITGSWDDSKTPTYERLIERANAKPDIVIARSPTGAIVQLVPKKAAQELAKTLKQAGKLKREKPEQSAAEKKAREKQNFENKISAREKTVTLEVINRAIVQRGVGLEGQRMLLDVMLHHAGMDGCRLMAEWLKLGKVQPADPKKSKQVDQADYRREILKAAENSTKEQYERLCVIAFISKNVKQGWALDYFLKPLLTHYGIKMAAIKEEAKKEVKAELDSKSAKRGNKANGPVKPLVNDGMESGKTVSGAAAGKVKSGKAVKEGAGKLSKENVSKAIKAIKGGKAAKPAAAAQGELVFDEEAELKAKIREYRENNPKVESYHAIAEAVQGEYHTVARLIDELIDESIAKLDAGDAVAAEVAKLNDEWLALKKPGQGASPEQHNEWAKNRMRIKRGLKKHGREVPKK